MTTDATTAAASVADVMTVRPITVGPDDSLLFAWELMARGDIHHLPVVVDRSCLSILDDRTVAGALANPLARPRLRVADVMPARVHRVLADTMLRRAAAIMREERTTALPVVDEHMTLVGLITETDIVQAVASGTW